MTGIPYTSGGETMADIVKRTDKPRDKPYRVRVRRTGHKPITKYFRTKESAKSWARQQEDSIERFGVPAISDKLKELLGQKEDKDKGIKDGILWRYIKEVTPTKGSTSELPVLMRFADDPMCKLSLAVLSVQREHAYEYRDRRLKSVWTPKGAKKSRPITPRTVRREINSISHVFTKARDEWGYRGLVNPFEGMEVEGSSSKRTRVLRPGEYKKLLDGCKGCRGVNKFYSGLIITFAKWTGMRLQEIINLRWYDIDLPGRTVTILKSKTDKQQVIPGRVIAMPFIIECAIEDLFKYTMYIAKGEPVTEERMFPITVSAFKQLWHDLVIRAGIPSKEEDAKNGGPE